MHSFALLKPKAGIDINVFGWKFQVVTHSRWSRSTFVVTGAYTNQWQATIAKAYSPEIPTKVEMRKDVKSVCQLKTLIIYIVEYGYGTYLSSKQTFFNLTTQKRSTWKQKKRSSMRSFFHCKFLTWVIVGVSTFDMDITWWLIIEL